MIRPPLAAPIATLLIASFIAQPIAIYAGGEARYSESEVVQRELQRRQLRVEEGKLDIKKGKEALAKKDYETAFANFDNACKKIPNAAATKGEYEEAVDGLTLAGRRLAEQRVTEGYYASAVQILQEVLKYNPDDKRTLKLIANIEAPDYFNKQITPQHRAKVEEVKQDFVAAKGYKDLGNNNMALHKVEEIFNKDPDNIAASKLRGEIYETKQRAAEAAYDATRSQAVWEVTSQWQRPYRRFDRKVTEIRSDKRSDAPNTVIIKRKLSEIVLPKVDFRDSTVREAMEFLNQRARALDTEGTGVNIVLKLEGAGGAPAPVAPTGGGGVAIPGLADPGAAAPAAAPSLGGGGGDANTRITLTLNNVPLLEVIKYITNLANLKYKIEPYAVYIVPLGTDTTEMHTREFKVSATLFRETPGGGGGTGLAAPAAGGAAPADPTIGGGGTALAASQSAKDFLQANGVTFPQGAFAMYSKATSTLIVKNTDDQLDLVERVIEISSTETAIKQIEIQAKFVEITQNNLKELSFDWLLGQSNFPKSNGVFLGGGTSGTAPQVDPADYVFTQGGQPIGSNPLTQGLRSGQLGISANAIDALLFGTAGQTLKAPGVFSVAGAGTDPTFQVVMRALDQKKGVDLLSAPRVTTKSGNRAVIEIIREFRYPIEFEQPQIPQTFGNQGNQGVQLLPGGNINPLAFNNNGSFPVTPTTPTTFETRNTGVTLEVEPNIGPDGSSIDMQLAPQVVEFEGFINYGSPIQTTSSNAIGQTQVNIITPNIINQPIFSTRKVSTNVTVFDGATVVLGGLVREDVQKVEDKVPFVGDIPLVGRLFRSNIDQHIKRNLVIFVTARIINAEGQPIVSDEEKEEKADELPMPEVAPSTLPAVDFKQVREPRRLK